MMVGDKHGLNCYVFGDKDWKGQIYRMWDFRTFISSYLCLQLVAFAKLNQLISFYASEIFLGFNMRGVTMSFSDTYDFVNVAAVKQEQLNPENTKS